MRPHQRFQTFSHDTLRAFAAILIQRAGVQSFLLQIQLILGTENNRNHGLQGAKGSESYGPTHCIL